MYVELDDAVSVSSEMAGEERLAGLIRKAREKKYPGKQEAAARALGIQPPYLSRLETGKGVPSIDLIERMVEELDADRGALMGALAAIEREKVDARLRPFLVPDPTDSATVKSNANARKEGRFPLVGLAACGDLMEAIKRDDPLPHGEVRTTDPWPEALKRVKSKRAFAVIAEGKSMLPTIGPGDELLVDPSARKESGCIVLVRLDDKVTIKRWYLTDGIISLRPDNPDRKAFPERSMSEEDFAERNGEAWRCILVRPATKEI